MTSPAARSSASESSSALERGADVLLLFANSSEPSLGVTQIAHRLGLSKAVVHRILSALRKKGLVDLDEASRRYSLGPVIISLGLTYLQRLDVRTVALPELTRLSRETNETTTLSVRTGSHRVYVDQVTPMREVLMSVKLGVPYPLHAGASSKAMLAFLPSEERDQLLGEPLAKLTGATITDRRRLRRELALIVERGWATSVGERQSGAGSVAAPIFDVRGYPIAAASVCGPAERMLEEFDVCGEKLLGATSRVSQRMGHLAAPSGPL